MTSLSYEEGMGALKSMFPTWDVQVLSEILEANSGHLENTIDMVLSMDSSNSSSTTTTTTTSPPLAPSSSNTRSNVQQGGNRNDSTGVKLPDDFLRLPDCNSSYELSAQEQQDAILAEMLQNEIFRDELMRTDEFSTYFNGEAPRAGYARQNRTKSSSTQDEKTAGEYAAEVWTTVSEKVSAMSEVMKKKMQELYVKYQTRDDAPKERDPYSHRPLMADDSSDEDDQNLPDMRKRPHRQVTEEEAIKNINGQSDYMVSAATRRTNTGRRNKKDM